jgi:hypothetical protein
VPKVDRRRRMPIVVFAVWIVLIVAAIILNSSCFYGTPSAYASGSEFNYDY